MSSPTPPFVSNRHDVSIDDINLFGEKLTLTAAEMKYAKGLFELIQLKQRELGINEITDAKAKSHSGARRRLDNLHKKGLLEKTERKVEGVRRGVAVYSFKRLTVDAVSSTPQRPTPSLKRKSIGALSGNPMRPDQQLQQGFSSSPAIDDLICSVLFGALEFNRQGKNQELGTRVDWYGESVPVVARCISGVDRVIARVTDLKYYICCLTFCEQIISRAIAHNETPKNLFAIDLGDINSMLKRANSGGNIETAVNALQRLADTALDIEELPKRILERFGFESGSQRINPISNFGIYEEFKSDAEVRSSVTVTFSIPEAVFQGIISDRINIFRVNPALLDEKNEVLFAFHLFCRRLIGTKASMHWENDLRRLKQFVAPNPELSHKKFVERLTHGLTEHHRNSNEKNLKPITFSADGKEILEYNHSVYGYVVRIKNGRINVHIDVSDNYVGINSISRVLKKRAAQKGALSEKPSVKFEDVDVNQMEQNLSLFDK